MSGVCSDIFALGDGPSVAERGTTLVQPAAARRRGGYRTRGVSAFFAVCGGKNQGLAAATRRAAGRTAVCLRLQNVGRMRPPVSQTQTCRVSGRPQPAGDCQEQGRRFGRQFDDQGEQLGQRVSRRCAGFCAGCWWICGLAARIRWLLDSPWGYSGRSQHGRILRQRGDAAVSFSVCRRMPPSARLTAELPAKRWWRGGRAGSRPSAGSSRVSADRPAPSVGQARGNGQASTSSSTSGPAAKLVRATGA